MSLTFGDFVCHLILHTMSLPTFAYCGIIDVICIGANMYLRKNGLIKEWCSSGFIEI